MLRRVLCKLGFHSWERQSDQWVKPDENGYEIRYLCWRCCSASKTIEYTDAGDRHEGRCVATTIEEWHYER